MDFCSLLVINLVPVTLYFQNLIYDENIFSMKTLRFVCL